MNGQFFRRDLVVVPNGVEGLCFFNVFCGFFKLFFRKWNSIFRCRPALKGFTILPRGFRLVRQRAVVFHFLDDFLLCRRISYGSKHPAIGVESHRQDLRHGELAALYHVIGEVVFVLVIARRNSVIRRIKG